jgi:hypothetical protein
MLVYNLGKRAEIGIPKGIKYGSKKINSNQQALESSGAVAVQILASGC